MKIQDILFFVVFGLLLYKSNPKLSAAFGIFSLIASIPLFASWVFFTADRLVWYAAGFLLLSAVQFFLKK